MCLGIPGRILDIRDDRGLLMGTVDFGGVQPRGLPGLRRRRGDAWATTWWSTSASPSRKVDEVEARRTFEVLREMSQLEELDWMREVAERSLAARPGGA